MEEQKAAILEDARVYFTAGKPNTWLIDKFFEHHAQDAPEVAKAIAESVAEHYPNTELEDEALLAIARLWIFRILLLKRTPRPKSWRLNVSSTDRTTPIHAH